MSAPPRFPTAHVLLVAIPIALHLVLVAWAQGAFPGGEGLWSRGGIVAGRVQDAPWRLLTSIFLHSDVRHALMNAASMIVFAVPLLGWLGGLRTLAVYLAAGVGGGLMASLVSPPGTLIVGSSGAVAGLFGAWVTLGLRAARFAPIGWRKRVRTVGIALLVLPSLLSPVTASGQRISVGAHVGGMLTGLLIGALLSSSLVPREALPFDDEPDEDGDEEDREEWVN